MNEKHTPGPWVIDESRHGKRGPVHTLMVVAEKGGMPGLIVNQGALVEPQDWANARLISASPDMLEALKAILYADETFGDHSIGAADWAAMQMKALELARSAIAKAEGRKAK